MGPTTGRRRRPPTVELAKSTLPSASRTPIVIRPASPGSRWGRPARSASNSTPRSAGRLSRGASDARRI